MATDNPLPGAQPTGTSSGNQEASTSGTSGYEPRGRTGSDPAADVVSATAASMGDAVRTAASDLLGQVKQQASSKAEVQKERAAESLAGVAEAVREAGDRLREQAPAVASYVDTAVTQLEELSTTLREKDPAEFVSDLEDLARRRPAMFIGGAFLLGLALARFLKSTAAAPASDWHHEGVSDRGRDVRRPSAAAGGYGAGTSYGLEQG